MISGIASLIFLGAIRAPIAALAREFRPDLIHGHMATPDGYAAARLGNELGLPVVCSLRGSDINVAPKKGRLIRRLTISALRNADRITAVSGALRREARQLVPREIEVVYTGLDTARFRPDPETRAAIRAQMKIDDRTCVFGLVANLIREKGVYELFHAFERVVSAGRNSVLWLVGDGHEGARLRSIVDQRGLRDRVHFTGRVSHDRVAGLLNAIDAMVLPSRAEGLPNAIVEALACQCAVIATRVGGVEEVIAHRKTGWLVDALDADGLVGALTRHADDPELRRTLALAGRDSVLGRYSWTRNAAELAEMYRTVIGRRDRPTPATVV